jgi:hypothetical protein
LRSARLYARATLAHFTSFAFSLVDLKKEWGVRDSARHDTVLLAMDGDLFCACVG